MNDKRDPLSYHNLDIVMRHDIHSTSLASVRQVGMVFVPRYSHFNLMAYMTVRAATGPQQVKRFQKKHYNAF